MQKDTVLIGGIYLVDDNYIGIPLKLTETFTSFDKYETKLLGYRTPSNKYTDDFKELQFSHIVKGDLLEKYDLEIVPDLDTKSLIFSIKGYQHIIPFVKVSDRKGLSTILNNLIMDFNEDVAKEKKSKESMRDFEEIRELGQQVVVQDIVFEEPEVIISVVGDSIQEKYTSIVSNLSKLTRDINEGYSLGAHKDIADAFLKAKGEIKKLSVQQTEPGKLGMVGRLLAKSKIYTKSAKVVEDANGKSTSTQENIDYLFGLIYTKYENFIVIGEKLQASKGQMTQQIEALKGLLKESNAEMKRYKKKVNIPMRVMVLNTQIKTGIEKYKQRLTKIDGAIIATQSTIMALSKDLPAMKTDLTDELAISSLLHSVDDYQQMYEEAANLIKDVTESTAKQTHTVVENLLEMQIKDTSALDYLKASGQRAEDFTKMFMEKTEKLSAKIHSDSETVSDIASKVLPTPNMKTYLK